MIKKISIIIVTYNSENDIFECIDSIFRFNDIGTGLEVIVVDNKSANIDAMFLQIKKQYADKVQCYKNDQNGGYGQGNNIGISYATAPYIMIMNPDVRLIEPLFSKVLQHFTASDVAMVGMVQMLSAKRYGTSFSVQTHRNPLRRCVQNLIANKLLIYSYKTMYLAGACFFIRKKTFEEIGSFDENIFMYGEENDLHYRFRTMKSKMRIVFDKHLHYLHLEGYRSFSEKTLRLRCESNMYVLRKYGFSEIQYLRNERKRIIIGNILLGLCGKSRLSVYSDPNVVFFTEELEQYAGK